MPTALSPSGTDHDVSKHILYLLQQAPYLDSRLFEAFDALLVAAAFEQRVSVLFRGDGVLQLLADQAPVGQRNLAKMLQSLATYEVDKVYADSRAFEARGLKIADCAIEPQLVSKREIAELIAQHDLVLND